MNTLTLKEPIQSLKEQSVALQLYLKPMAKVEKKVILVCNHNSVFNPNLLFLDLDPKVENFYYKTYDLDSFLKLTKKEIKKFIKTYSLITIPGNSSKILKNLGKKLQCFNKTPIFVTGTPNLKELECKHFIKVESNLVQSKLGSSTLDLNLLNERIGDLIETLKNKNYEVLKGFVKTTQGKKIWLQ